MALTKSRRSYIGLLYITPWIIGFLVFQAYPIVSSFIFSFTDFDMLETMNFVGADNYVKMFTRDPEFYNTLLVTFMYVLYAVPMKVTFALVIALVLNARIKGINFFRTVYYLPSILGGSVAVALLWRFIFMREGTVNTALGAIGIGPVGWLSSPSLALFTVSLLTVWQFGSSMVLFLAGLKQIPKELYEAAKVDGASRPRMFFRITLPMLSPIVFFNLVMQMVNSFQEFTGAFVITQKGPLNSTFLYVMKLYWEGFNFFKMGYASALSWVLFAIIIITTFVAFRTSNAWVYYGDSGTGK